LATAGFCVQRSAHPVLGEVICSESSQIGAVDCGPDAVGGSDAADDPDAVGGSDAADDPDAADCPDAADDPDAAGNWAADWLRAVTVPQPATSRTVASRTMASAYALSSCPQSFSMPHAPGALAGDR
jgi:hypothetical protein